MIVQLLVCKTASHLGVSEVHSELGQRVEVIVAFVALDTLLN